MSTILLENVLKEARNNCRAADLGEHAPSYPILQQQFILEEHDLKSAHRARDISIYRFDSTSYTGVLHCGNPKIRGTIICGQLDTGISTVGQQQQQFSTGRSCSQLRQETLFHNVFSAFIHLLPDKHLDAERGDAETHRWSCQSYLFPTID